MPNNTYNRVGDNALITLLTLIKNKFTNLEGLIPTVDNTVTSDGGNPVSSKAVATYVTNAISAINTIKFEKVSALPSTGKNTTIYLIPNNSSGTSNVYDEYIYINNAWEKLGSTDIDLSGYVQASEMHEMTAEEITTIFNAAWGD